MSSSRKSLSRRNLTPDQMSLLRGRRYNRAKKAPGAPVGNSNAAKQGAHSAHFEKTAEKLAKQHGVHAFRLSRERFFGRRLTVADVSL